MRVAHSKHASQNPKAFLKDRVTVADVMASRWICKPLHLLDCCLETDNATALIVTSARSGRATCGASRSTSWAWPAGSTSRAPISTGPTGPITRVAGYHAKDIVFGQAGIKPEDVDVTGSYDAFTFTTMLQLEEYGFCKKGEGGAVRLERHHRARAASGPTTPRAATSARATPTACSMVIENVRQLRGQVDDYCPGWEDGKHSYDYSPGKCRQVKDARITMNLGWAMPPTGSALIMHTELSDGLRRIPRHEPGDPGERLASGASTSSSRAPTTS